MPTSKIRRGGTIVGLFDDSITIRELDKPFPRPPQSRTCPAPGRDPAHKAKTTKRARKPRLGRAGTTRHGRVSLVARQCSDNKPRKHLVENKVILALVFSLVHPLYLT